MYVALCRIFVNNFGRPVGARAAASVNIASRANRLATWAVPKGMPTHGLIDSWAAFLWVILHFGTQFQAWAASETDSESLLPGALSAPRSKVLS